MAPETNNSRSSLSESNREGATQSRAGAGDDNYFVIDKNSQSPESVQIP